jgi:hypothetical protein
MSRIWARWVMLWSSAVSTEKPERPFERSRAEPHAEHETNAHSHED